jgi:hypothetical protein
MAPGWLVGEKGLLVGGGNKLLEGTCFDIHQFAIAVIAMVNLSLQYIYFFCRDWLSGQPCSGGRCCYRRT